MYQDNLAYAPNKGAQEVADHAPEFQSISQRLSDLNGRNQGYINEIQEKLHNILNLRVPQKEQNGKADQPSINSFVDQMNLEIYKVASIGDQLEQILSHLKRII